jgi:transposase
MRQVALDVHQGFCEVAVREDGETRSAGRIATNRGALELFAESLCRTDEVVMEATGPAMEIARILEPHVARVVVANAQDVRAISHARVKSDRFDARTLADLLAAGMLEPVWVPDAETSALRRRVARRAAWAFAGLGPVRQGRTRVARRTGVGHRGAGDSRRVSAPDRLPGRRDRPDRSKARRVGEKSSQEARRLMSVSGVGVGVAVTLMAAIGDISRFSSPRQLVAYLGLDPKVRQSGDEPARHGRI